MTIPIPDCPQPETPIRERAWSDAQKAAHFTAEEVLEMASVLLHNPKPREWKTRAGNMLTAYADALSKPADSGRVGDGPLSSRLRPQIECAPWVIEEVRKIEAALAQHGQPKISELRMEQLADAAAALDKMGRRDQCRHLMWLHEELQALQHGQPREELPACPHHWHIIYTGTGREEWECTECFQRGGFAERPVSRQGIEQTYNDGYSAGRRTHPERQASAQGEAVAWRIDTDDDVERVAKSVGWDNRRYMTPADYAIWCSRMREFVRLAAGHAALPASPAGVPDLVRFAIERCLRSQEALVASIDKANPDDPYASVLVAEDIEYLRAWLAAAPSAPEGDGDRKPQATDFTDSQWEDFER